MSLHFHPSLLYSHLNRNWSLQHRLMMGKLKSNANIVCEMGKFNRAATSWFRVLSSGMCNSRVLAVVFVTLGKIVEPPFCFNSLALARSKQRKKEHWERERTDGWCNSPCCARFDSWILRYKSSPHSCLAYAQWGNHRACSIIWIIVWSPVSQWAIAIETGDDRLRAGVEESRSNEIVNRW